MGIIHFLSTLKKTFYSILSLCSLAWNPFFWHKCTCRLLLLLYEEITSALTFGSKSSTEENAHMLSVTQDKQHSDNEELRDELRRMQDINSSSISKLCKFEEKVENLETDLSGEKERWKTKFQDQQALKEQQEKYVHLEESRSDNLMPQYTDATDGFVESNANMRDGLHRRLGEQTKSTYGRSWAFLNEYNSVKEHSSLKYSSLPSTCSSVSYFDCANTRKATKCFRVFVPRSPLDLNIGSRVKVLLPCGKVGTGVVYKLGQLPGKDEVQVGVEVESQECWQHLSNVQYKFQSDPPSGVLVPFSKVLMVWE
ncbi:uncharacterized protein LOC130357861 [Hyla sarda]|uniref:uncharacterized protein LOC130357861 n=1 Tax=Hyla sarda TaxID=327740 RepID=UPI0024C3E0FF|nr:uncharacterized protein LOC130357861 [Hyla sarda]XP_056416575.1 uncharacterized protein LOC130357861 [Hyla sarda]